MLMHIIKSHRGSMMMRSVEHEGKSQFSRGPDSKPSFPPLHSSFELTYANMLALCKSTPCCQISFI